MNKRNHGWRAVLLSILFVSSWGGVASPSHAGDSYGVKKKSKVSRVTRPYAYERLNVASELMAEGKYDAAMAKLKQLEKSKKVNVFEKALLKQSVAMIHYSNGDFAAAAKSFESIEDGILDPVAEQNLKYNLAQLYLALERPRKAISIFKKWFIMANNPVGGAYIAFANAYVQIHDYPKAIPLVEKACETDPNPKEAWMKLLLALYLDVQKYKLAATTLESLLERFPEPRYWVQLSSVYSELGREKDALLTLELGYRQGYLTKSNQIIRLAQLLIMNGVPYKGAVILEESLEEGNIKANKSNYELWAAALIQAQEVEKSLEPLRLAAGLSQDGNLDLMLAQILVQRESWKEAMSAIDRATNKKKLKNPGMAQILAGYTQLNQGKMDLARKYYAKARTHKKTRSLANQYLAYLDDVEANQ